MGVVAQDKTKMMAFVLAALAGLAAAAPHQVLSANGVAVAHSHSSPVVAHGAVPVLAHPFAHAVAHPVAHAFAHPAAHAVAHPAVAVSPLPHAVHAAPVIAHHAPAAHAVHAAPAYAAPVVAAPAYHEPAYKETPEPYTYTYGVSDDYSKANFNAAETSDANGVVSGSYSVA